jgi:hypothetical protein
VSLGNVRMALGDRRGFSADMALSRGSCLEMKGVYRAHSSLVARAETSIVALRIEYECNW